MKNELSVKGEQKWGAGGYKDEKKTVRENKPSFINTEGIGSNNFVGIGGGSSTSSSTYDKYSNNNNNTRNRKKEEDLNPENQEKKKLMKDLFGGLDGSSNEEKPKKDKEI